MVINCINLSSREDRLLSVSKQAKQQKFAIKFWEGIQEKNVMPFKSVSKAHKQIVKDAKDNNYESVTICEDDIKFSCPNAFDYYISKMPEQYDLFLGMVYSAEINEGRIMNGFSGLTLYTVHNRFYDEFLAANPNDHLDRYLGNTAYKNKYYVCEPFVCYQSGGMSDNLRIKMDYKVYHEKMNFYVG